MTLVPTCPDDVTMMSSKEYWEDVPRSVHFGKTEGDVEQQQKVTERIAELGLLQNKLHIERELMGKLELLMQKKDSLYSVLNQFRRKRPLKDRLNQTISEIRNLIHPSIIRDDAGRKTEYHVSVLMGFFTKGVKYQVDRDRKIVLIYGETPEEQDKLTKEVVLEFPEDVDMSRVDAEYVAGVFKVSVPFGSRRNFTSSDDHSFTETESLPSVDCQSTTSLDCQSVTSSDDVRDSLLSPAPIEMEQPIIWV